MDCGRLYVLWEYKIWRRGDDLCKVLAGDGSGQVERREEKAIGQVLHQLRQAGQVRLQNRFVAGIVAGEKVRREGGRVITIAEYVEWKQPKVYSKLLLFIEKVKILAFVKFLEWKQIMEEPPRPGLGGLLEGEKAV